MWSIQIADGIPPKQEIVSRVYTLFKRKLFFLRIRTHLEDFVLIIVKNKSNSVVIR